MTVTIAANFNKVENLACGNEKYKIIGEKYTEKSKLSYSVELNWDEIFSTVGTYLVSFKNYTTFENNLR